MNWKPLQFKRASKKLFGLKDCQKHSQIALSLSLVSPCTVCSRKAFCIQIVATISLFNKQALITLNGRNYLLINNR